MSVWIIEQRMIGETNQEPHRWVPYMAPHLGNEHEKQLTLHTVSDWNREEREDGIEYRAVQYVRKGGQR